MSRIAFDGSLIGTYPVHGPPNAIAVGAHAVWVAIGDLDRVHELDPATGSVVQEIEVPDGPVALAEVGDSLWVCALDAGVIARIDQATHEVTHRLDVDGVPQSIVADSNGDLWVGVGPRLE